MFRKDQMPLKVVVGILGAALLTGCAGLPGYFKDPDVHLQRVVVRGVGATGGTMDLMVGVYNPNAFALQGTRLQLGLDVESSHVGDIEYNSGFQTQQGDTTVLTLPLRFTWTGLAGAARTALGYGELPYTMKGQLAVATPIGERTVAFTRQGRAPLSRVGGLIQVPTGH